MRFSVYCLSFNNHGIHKIKQQKNICMKEKKLLSVLTSNPGLAFTAFRTILPCLRQVNQTWARDPMENQYLVRGQLKKNVTSISYKIEPSLWSRDTGQRIPCFDRCQLFIDGCPILEKYTVNQGCMSLSSYYLDYSRYVARLRRRRAYAPTGNTASRDNHEKMGFFLLHIWVWGSAWLLPELRYNKKNFLLCRLWNISA